MTQIECICWFWRTDLFLSPDIGLGGTADAFNSISRRYLGCMQAISLTVDNKEGGSPGMFYDSKGIFSRATLLQVHLQFIFSFKQAQDSGLCRITYNPEKLYSLVFSGSFCLLPSLDVMRGAALCRHGNGLLLGWLPATGA